MAKIHFPDIVDGSGVVVNAGNRSILQWLLVKKSISIGILCGTFFFYFFVIQKPGKEVMKKPHNSLYEIIHSLSREHKRKFRIQLSAGGYQMHDKLYLKVYDIIVRRKIQSDEEIKKYLTFRERRSYATIKQYLIRKLRSFINANTMNPAILLPLEIEYFYKKGLYSAVVDRFEKGEKHRGVTFPTLLPLLSAIQISYYQTFHFPFLQRLFVRMSKKMEKEVSHYLEFVRSVTLANQIARESFKLHFSNKNDYLHRYEQMKKMLTPRLMPEAKAWLLYALIRIYLQAGYERRKIVLLQERLKKVIEYIPSPTKEWFSIQYLFYGAQLYLHTKEKNCVKYIDGLIKLKEHKLYTAYFPELLQKIYYLSLRYFNHYGRWPVLCEEAKIISYFENKKDRNNKFCIYCTFELVKYFFKKQAYRKVVWWCNVILKDYHREKDINVILLTRLILIMAYRFLGRHEEYMREKQLIFRYIQRVHLSPEEVHVKSVIQYIRGGCTGTIDIPGYFRYPM